MSPAEKNYFKDLMDNHVTWQAKAKRLLNILCHWFCTADFLKEKLSQDLLTAFSSQKLLEPEHIECLKRQTLKNFLPTLQDEDTFTRVLMRFLKGVVRTKG